LSRIEAHEEQLINNPNYVVNEDEKRSIAKKEETVTTVRELYTVLPQVAELSQKLAKEAEIQKAQAELLHQEEMLKFAKAEKDKYQLLLSKAISLFAAVFFDSHNKLSELLPEEKSPLAHIASKFISQPFTNHFEIINLLESLCGDPDDKVNLGVPVSVSDLERIIEKANAYDPSPKIMEQNIYTSTHTTEYKHDVLLSLSFMNKSGADIPCDADFCSPEIFVEQCTLVPPGGIFFLNPSEIYPGEPRALFKSP